MYLTFDIVNTNDFYSVSSVKQLGFLFLSPTLPIVPFPSFKYSKAGKTLWLSRLNSSVKKPF